MNDDLHRVTKLCIGWPWQPPMCWTKVMDNYLSIERPQNSFWVRGGGGTTARRHIEICEKGQEAGASHILILGADQIHPIDMIPRLIKRVEEDKCDVISASIPANGKPGKLRYFQRSGWVRSRSENRLVNLDVSKGELQKIATIGSGVLMFPTVALDDMMKPWFKDFCDPETLEFSGITDTEFVTALAFSTKMKIWVDTTIDVKHLLPMEVDGSFEERFNDWNTD